MGSLGIVQFRLLVVYMEMSDKLLIPCHLCPLGHDGFQVDEKNAGLSRSDKAEENMLNSPQRKFISKKVVFK